MPVSASGGTVPVGMSKKVVRQGLKTPQNRRGRNFEVLAGALALLIGVGPSPASALLWPSEVVRIERELSSSEVAVRRRAAHQLRELPEKVAARAVLRALADDDLEVRLLAAETAKQIRMPQLSDLMLPWLTEAEPRVRLAAAEVLATEASPRAVGPLSRALSDVEPQVRAAAAAALGASGAKEAVIGLLGRLDDSSLEVKESVIRALARLGDARAVVPLVSKIEDPRPAVRSAVAQALGELGDPRAVSALVLALRDADPSVRANALEALGELGDPSAVPSVSASLFQESVASVRGAAMEALGRLGTPEAVTKLIEALGTLSEEREALVRALARTGKASIPALIHCLGTTDDRGRADGCALSLSLVRGPDSGAAILEAVRRGRVSPEAALSSFAELGDSSALPLALEHLSHRDPTVRRAALRAAAALLDPERPDGRAVEPLELAFRAAKSRRAERLELLGLLGETGSPRAARVLVPIADSADDLEYRLLAIRALGTIQDASATPALLRALSDPEPSLRMAAALAIRKSAPANTAGELMDRLERAGAQDRSALALALAGSIAEAPDAIVSRVAQAALRADGGERDALIEALSHARAPSALAQLTALSESRDPADRAKVAEGLSLDPRGLPRLALLARDPDADVRANAVWAIGAVGTAAERPGLVRALSDHDVGVAANAASALGRLALRLEGSAAKELCRALQDRRAAVRASALAALRLTNSRCDGQARALIGSDPSARVRRAAAELLRDVTPEETDARALRRCAAREVTGSVAATCAGLPANRTSGSLEVLVFVIPAGESAPVERASFALRRPDSLVRYGRTDRRGAVCESFVPAGELSLDVPAALE